MADVQVFPFRRHLRGSSATHVRHVRNGRLLHAGVGHSFWFRPLSDVLSEIPVDDRELPLLFHARTSDYHDVTVQATVTYRVEDPELAAMRIDFGIDPLTGKWRASPVEQLGALITELAQQYALDLLARTPLETALVEGLADVRERIAAGLAADPRLAETGIGVIGVRVWAIRPQPDVEKALGTPARELVQQEADRATFERRALAVERERAIAENELATQIELATRQERLIAQEGANERRRAEEAAAAGRIEAEAHADATRMQGEAEGAAERARLSVYGELEAPTVLGLALRDLAGSLPDIERLTITPDLVTDALARVAGSR
jgi:regulator of protease activity HflC (stomatin/prohibitin superfamily)